MVKKSQRQHATLRLQEEQGLVRVRGRYRVGQLLGSGTFGELTRKNESA